MILKASQRGGAKQLAIHLMRTDENDHVELHEVKGFVADDLTGALREAYAISKGTRCEQFLFSVSLSPPEKERVPVEVFETAIDAIEAKLGLDGQPRVIVFHEKNGRRHAHCVWSRIDADRMRAINLPHFKLKLRDLSRSLFIEHGWHMPLGLVNSAERDPRNFTRAEWQQVKRADHDPATLKEAFQDCWAISDSRKAFAQALAARGLYLARGDRRGFVAVDIKGEVYAIARWTGLKTKIVEARLGDPSDLPSVAETKAKLAELLQGVLGRHLSEADTEHQARMLPLQQKRAILREVQRTRRRDLLEEQTRRAIIEAHQRSARFRKGLIGLWDRITGRHAKIRGENQADIQAADRRDRTERQRLIDVQLEERRTLHVEIKAARHTHANETALIFREICDLDVANHDPAHRSNRDDRDAGPRKRKGLDP